MAIKALTKSELDKMAVEISGLSMKYCYPMGIVNWCKAYLNGEKQNKWPVQVQINSYRGRIYLVDKEELKNAKLDEALI